MSAVAVFVLDTPGAGSAAEGTVAGGRPASSTGTAPGDVAGGLRRIDPGQASILALDLGVTRGDGVFETIGVVGGAPQAVEAHLTRLAHSAQMLELPEPDLARWRDAVHVAAAALPADVQGGLKLVLTRGVEGTGIPTAWITASTADRDFAERQRGIGVVTLDRGYSSDVATRSPWLLAGAKTLSYAVNMAALREARRRGADDAIFLSTDGFVMEGPNSTVVMRRGDTFTTPATEIGILPGTSQLSLFDFYRAEGFGTEQRPVASVELESADALWLVSSVRLAAPVVRLNGRAIAWDAEMTARMNQALLGRAG